MVHDCAHVDIKLLLSRLARADFAFSGQTICPISMRPTHVSATTETCLGVAAPSIVLEVGCLTNIVQCVHETRSTLILAILNRLDPTHERLRARLSYSKHHVSIDMPGLLNMAPSGQILHRKHVSHPFIHSTTYWHFSLDYGSMVFNTTLAELLHVTYNYFKMQQGSRGEIMAVTHS
jgi:hypothetical protein